MEVRPLPVMSLSAQPHSAVFPLLSTRCQWMSTGNNKKCMTVFVSHVHLHIYTLTTACVCAHVLWKYDLVHLHIYLKL